MRRCSAAIALAFPLVFAATAAAEFFPNSSFEIVPGSATGQGNLPTGWLQTGTFSPGADTYSNDGSYGLPPEGFGNFPGVTAFDGIRWLAAGAFGRTASSVTIGGEAFGITLDEKLIAGEEYDLDARLHQALRQDLNNPGGYHLFLAEDASSAGLANAVLLGALAPTTGQGGWEARSLTFTAPADASARSVLVFAPYQATAGNAYPGIDVTTLARVGAAVPEPASLTLALIGGTGLIAVARRRQSRAAL